MLLQHKQGCFKQLGCVGAQPELQGGLAAGAQQVCWAVFPLLNYLYLP